MKRNVKKLGLTIMMSGLLCCMCSCNSKPKEDNNDVPVDVADNKNSINANDESDNSIITPIPTPTSIPVTEEPTIAATVEPTKSVTIEPTKPVSVEPTETVTTAPTKPVAEEPTKPVEENPTEPIVADDSNDNPSETDTYEVDADEMYSFLEYPIDDVVEKYGQDYEVVESGDVDPSLGYKYKNGLTFIFELDEDLVVEIRCEDNISFRGTHGGMTFEEINDILGKEELKMGDIKERDDYYYITYTEDCLVIVFTSTDGNGTGSKLSFQHKL